PVAAPGAATGAPETPVLGAVDPQALATRERTAIAKTACRARIGGRMPMAPPPDRRGAPGPSTYRANMPRWGDDQACRLERRWVAAVGPGHQGPQGPCLD